MNMEFGPSVYYGKNDYQPSYLKSLLLAPLGAAVETTAAVAGGALFFGGLKLASMLEGSLANAISNPTLLTPATATIGFGAMVVLNIAALGATILTARGADWLFSGVVGYEKLKERISDFFEAHPAIAKIFENAATIVAITAYPSAGILVSAGLVSWIPMALISGATVTTAYAIYSLSTNE